MYILTGNGLGFPTALSQGTQDKLTACFSQSPCTKDIPREFLLLNSKPLDILFPRLKKLDQFKFGVSALRTFHKPIIRQIARMVIAKARTKPFKTIFLVGAADEIGGFDKNCTLGKARAQTVNKELVKVLENLQPGITKGIHFVVLSNGECAPVIEKANRNKHNRYVQLWFSEESLPKTSSPSIPPTSKFVWYTQPLPVSEFQRFEKAIRNLENEVANIQDPRKQRYLCWIKKLKNPDVDDRIIGWSKICPSISGAIGASYVVGACDITQGTPVNQTEFERSIRSVSDVEKANQSLQFITHMRSAIVVAFEMTSLPLENLRRKTDDASQTILKLDQWANSPLGGSSAMPPAYRSIKSWIIQRQKDPKSLYSCF